MKRAARRSVGRRASRRNSGYPVPAGGTLRHGSAELDISLPTWVLTVGFVVALLAVDLVAAA